MSNYLFPHERLDAWHRAREARVLALRYTASLPPGLGARVAQEVADALAAWARGAPIPHMV